jgi:general secretion pathway protein B
MSLIHEALKKSEEERKLGSPPTLHSGFSRRPNAAPRPALWISLGALALLTLTWGGFHFLHVEKSVDAKVAAKPATPPTHPAPNAAGGTPTSNPSNAGQPGSNGQTPMTSADAMLIALGGAPTSNGSAGQTLTTDAQIPVSMPRLPGTLTDASLNGQNIAQNPSAPIPGKLPRPPMAQTPAPPAEQPILVPPTAEKMPSFSDPVAPPVVQTPAATPSPAPSNSIQTIYELDYPTRHDLPKLVLNMHVYNENAARRFVVFNGKRYTEASDAIEGKVWVREIRRDGVVLEYNGVRFLMPRMG